MLGEILDLVGGIPHRNPEASVLDHVAIVTRISDADHLSGGQAKVLGQRGDAGPLVALLVHELEEEGGALYHGIALIELCRQSLDGAGELGRLVDHHHLHDLLVGRQGGEVDQIDRHADQAGFVLGVGADTGTDEALGDRETVDVHLQLVGQSGDGAGVTAGQ